MSAANGSAFRAAVAVLGAVALGLIALHRGETINAAWVVLAASSV